MLHFCIAFRHKKRLQKTIIGSEFPEISKIVNKYDIGLLVNPENVDEIADAIEDMRTNSKMYTRFKTNLKKAKEELCWENESKVLAEAYGNILRWKV